MEHRAGSAGPRGPPVSTGTDRRPIHPEQNGEGPMAAGPLPCPQSCSPTAPSTRSPGTCQG
eukprot:1148470-Pyramimonas_sp.AAC.1